MRLIRFALSIAILTAVPAAAITPYRVADINPVPQDLGSFPAGFSMLGGRAIFVTLFTGEIWSTDGTEEGTVRIAEGLGASVVANSGTAIYFVAVERDPDGGFLGRLWVTDGTPAGTRSVLGDVPQGAFSSGFVVVPGTRRLFFTFNDSVHGRELWTSDGTVAGTRQVLDLRPGSGDGLNGFGNNLAVFHGKAYFSGDDGTGPALWVSDRTAGGTARIFGFGGPGEPAFGPFTFAPLGSRLLFFAQTPSSGIEPWATDGTAAGTVQLGEIGVGASSITNLSDVHSTGSLAYFAAAAEPEEGVELWRTDGTPGGTFPLTDFPGAEPFGRFSQLSIATVGSKVAFSADDGVHGFEPWTTDGSVAGTRLIKDICPGSCDGNRGGQYFARGSMLYFPATTHGPSSQDIEPWVSNLNAAGTRRLKDLCVGLCSSLPADFISAGGFVYLTAMDHSGRRQLWRTNGSAPGTVRLGEDITSSPGAPFESLAAVALGNNLLFSWPDLLHGRELWRSDGSRAGTRLLADLEHLDQGGSRPFRFMKAGTKSFFFANDGIHGSELWTSDGTAGGTRLVRELEPGPGPDTLPISGPSAEANGRLVFIPSFSFSRDPVLWGSDGTAAGTVRLLDEGVVVGPVLRAVGSKVYFIARDAVHGAEPWVTDGTKSGTRLLRDIEPGPGPVERDGEFSLLALKGRLLFRGGDSTEPDLWLSDGTPAGTKPLANVYPFLVEPLAELSGDPVELGDKLYFIRGDSGLDSALWVTDLTAAGTKPAPPFTDEPGLRNLQLFVAGPKIFVFGRSDQDDGLWATDGRPGGARRLGRFFLDPSSVARPTAFGGQLYFPGEDAGAGAPLWVTNGTVAGTHRVQDPSGTRILDSRKLVTFGNQLICATQTGYWATNGTAAGTARLLDRSQTTNPKDLVVAGSRLYFSHMDDETGTELWAFRP